MTATCTDTVLISHPIKRTHYWMSSVSHTTLRLAQRSAGSWSTLWREENQDMTWMWRCGKGPCIQGRWGRKASSDSIPVTVYSRSVPVLHNCTFFFFVDAEYQYHSHKKRYGRTLAGWTAAINVEILQNMFFSCSERVPRGLSTSSQCRCTSVSQLESNSDSFR